MPSLEDVIIRINQQIKILEGLQPLKPEDRQRLDKKFRLEFNYNSNHLEGNTLTYGETELLLIFDQTIGGHEMREYEEMKAHDMALRIIEAEADDMERPFTEQFIRQINEYLLVRPFWKEAVTQDGQPTRKKVIPGKYKNSPNSVRLQNGEIFNYASPQETPAKMQELIEWYNRSSTKEHPLVLASLLHYKFVCIHPFDDGNGRVSRLLMNYVLLKMKLPMVVIKTIDKKNYLAALNRADIGETDVFVAYIGEQLLWSLDLTIKAARGESIDEPDDLDKEITIWKKSAVQTKINVVKRDNDIVYELYQNSFRDLFLFFFEKHQQFFELFNKHKVSGFRNNGSNGGIEALDKDIDAIYKQGKLRTEKDGNLLNADDFKSLGIRIDLTEYKFNLLNPFNLGSALNIDLQAYKYIIRTDKVLIENAYPIILTSEESKNIVNSVVSNIFLEIKRQANQ